MSVEVIRGHGRLLELLKVMTIVLSPLEDRGTACGKEATWSLTWSMFVHGREQRSDKALASVKWQSGHMWFKTNKSVICVIMVPRGKW